ncbi:DUF2393 family protein [Granulicella sibirica]|uniref:DUF2393 domain-containing protein n=1 Tax=Granulicella sibirica TaxID=2479048 RepID=A0A4Q0TB10_9BACT|nr:DUF2393 family protein [Granulicella sibirica]RXH58831.1 hypothetical protein GRAN_2141 [Granulicella sibirica]
MSDSQPNVPTSASSNALFATPPAERGGFPKAAVFGAIGAVLVIVLGIVIATRGHHGVAAGVILPLDAHAASLPMADVAMSESTSLSGGKSTFIDGRIKNTGSDTITGITVQVLFRNDEGLAPQVETLPLMLIRTHEPYVDTQTVAAAPLTPGQDREFRLIFENINNNWNIQIPEVHVVQVATK